VRWPEEKARRKDRYRLPRTGNNAVVSSIFRVSFAFTLTVAFMACRSAPASAQSVPDLSGFDDVTRQSIELVCIGAKTKGPVAYGNCLNEQITAVRSSPGIPSLSGLDDVTRQSIELVCIGAKTKGPVAYGNCLNKQITAVRSSPGIPSLSGLDDVARQSIELACIGAKTKGPVPYGECLRAQLHSIGIQPGETGEATHIPSTDARHVPSNRRHTHVPATDATRVRASPPISPASNSTLPTASTDPSHATPRKYRGAPSLWQDPNFVALLALSIAAFIYLTPVIWVLLSGRSRGGAKLGWFLVVLFFSWLGLAVFLIVTQALRNRQNT
jgi:hypothetical protein